ncbi:MAG: gamma-glutamylcyclotransferase [Ectothiorhodospiraceae bacterium]|nr:gamma-glutamylcyclotransferase [Ectothiorhodospiraceae bacterium]
MTGTDARDRTGGAARQPPGAVSLTRALIDARHPVAPPPEPSAWPDLGADAIRASLEATLARHPRHHDLWVFGYGSLTWHPEMDAAEHRVATVLGWHRRFCLWQWRSRGTRERPGLMLALDRGGTCVGVAYRLTGPRLEDKLTRVWEREMRGNGYRPRWVTLRAGTSPTRGITFVVNRGGERYAGRLDEVETARHIAGACGSKGASAEYLRRLVLTLEGMGIRDPHVWRLQHLVADACRTDLAGPAPVTPTAARE